MMIEPKKTLIAKDGKLYEFAYMMSEEYQMSMMGELKFFLGLQIRQ